MTGYLIVLVAAFWTCVAVVGMALTFAAFGAMLAGLG